MQASGCESVSKEASRNKVHVSFVIPLFNKQSIVRSCVSAALSNSDESIETDIIVIDDGSRDGSYRAVSELGDNRRLRLIKSEHLGTAHAKNLGIAHSSGDWLVFLDADTVIEKDFLQAIRSHLGDMGTFIGVWVGALNNEKIIPRLIERWQRYQRTSPWGACVIYPRQILQVIGCFDDRMVAGEDGDLYLRAIKHGYRCLMVPRVVARTTHPENVASFLTQQITWGRGFALLKEKDSSNLLNLFPRERKIKFILSAAAAVSIALSIALTLARSALFSLMVIGICPILVYNARRNRDLIATQYKRKAYKFLFVCILSISDFGFLTGWILQKIASLLKHSSSSSPRFPWDTLLPACTATAPTFAFAQGTVAPAAGNLDSTAMPRSPLSLSNATIENVVGTRS